MNSDNPDLTVFKARGGKLIQYHGWNDPANPAQYSIRYFKSVKRRMGDPSGFYSLYMIPGMLHCGGGKGPSTVDWIGLIEAWVEHGKAPGDVTAKGEKGGAQVLKPWS
jgi:feruloyl esterase